MDTSKWVHIAPAKPIDPKLVIEAARAIRANPEIWSIFTSVKPDEWISEDDGVRIGRFVHSHFEQTGRPEIMGVVGMDVGLLRSHLAGSPKDLDDDEELMVWMKKRYGSRIVGGGE